MDKGYLIVLEGMDKAGKGTQCKLLNNYFNKKGRKSMIINFPDYTTSIGKEIRLYLDGIHSYPLQVQHMLLSANRWEKKETITDLLNTGMTIIMDRYYQSNLVYGISNGLDLNWLINLDLGLPKENIVIILEINPEVSNKRVFNRRDVFESDRELLVKVKNNYRKLAQIYDWQIIDGDKNIELVHEKICTLLKNKIDI